MSTAIIGRSLHRPELPPFPDGWYFVTTREELREKKLIERQWMGEEIVAWCDDEGRVCVAHAYCPHLGSHMGPTVGGMVRDGCLVCPFHGFEFDTGGDCVATPNAPPPKAAKLTLFETREIVGLIFAWWGVRGRKPKWYLPEEPSDESEWGRPSITTMRFRGHPQETTENSVDVEHLESTHGYHDVRQNETLIDGPYLKSSFYFKDIRRIFGLFGIEYDVLAVAHVWGLGYSLVEFHERNSDMHTRLWVLATPIDGTKIEFTLAAQSLQVRRPRRFVVGLGFLPMGVRQRLLARVAVSEARRYVGQDVTIWERKRYTVPPRLSRSDGPIGKYRLYCRQFYPELFPQRESA